MRDAARTSVQRAAALAGNRLRINAALIPTGGAAVWIQVAHGGAAAGIVAIGQGVHRVTGTASSAPQVRQLVVARVTQSESQAELQHDGSMAQTRSQQFESLQEGVECVT